MNRRYWNIPLNKGRSFEAGDLFDLKVLDLPENMTNRTITAEGNVTMNLCSSPSANDLSNLRSSMYVSAVLSWSIFGYTPTWTGG